VKLAAAFLAITTFMVGPGWAQEQEEVPLKLPMVCDPQVCFMPTEVAMGMIEAHNAQVLEVRELRKKLEDLRAIKGCAKLEVKPKPVIPEGPVPRGGRS
jgi:hypothetical protein